MSVEYVLCLFCGWSKPVYSEKYDGGVFEFAELDIPPTDIPVIQLRSTEPGPGRGHREKGVGGFHTVGQLSMAEALEDPAFSELAESMLNRLILIVKEYVRAGLIDPKDLLV